MVNKKIVQKFNEEASKWQYCLTDENEEFILGPLDVCVKVSYCLLRNPPEICNAIKRKDRKMCHPVGREISGVVESVGVNVTLFEEGDEVVGILPLDAEHSGCAHYCLISEYDIIRKPDVLTHLNAVCVIGDALKAYTALFYQAKVASGETIALAAAASGFGLLAAQLAVECGLNVIAIGSNDDDINFLCNLDLFCGRVLDLRNDRLDIVSALMRETNGIGVDCFIDSGLQISPQNELDEERSSRLERSHVISSLAVGGRWVTSEYGLQIEPSDSCLLALKCASIHFLFADSWTLSRGAQGKYLHILSDIMEKTKKLILKPKIYETVSFDESVQNVDELELKVQSNPIIVRMS